MIIQDLKKLFNFHGINLGDYICIHSDITSFGIPSSLKEQIKLKGINFLLDSYIDTFKAVVGEEGLIVMPTFTYSACKDEIYDIQESKSTVGVLTEYFRKQKDVYRSLHPIFSYAAWGKNSKDFLKLDSFDSFGTKSFFQKLYDYNVIYLLFGCNSQQSATFALYTEEKMKVYYRYYKYFSGKIKDGNNLIETDVRYFVRDLDLDFEDDRYALDQKALEKGVAKSFQYNGGTVIITRAQDIDRLIQEELEKEKDFFIRWK